MMEDGGGRQRLDLFLIWHSVCSKIADWTVKRYQRMKRAITRIALWVMALGATLFLCHASARLEEAAKNSPAFDDGLPPFSHLVLYSVYLYDPASCDACINNLRQIDGSKQEWAMETKAPPTATPTWKDIMPYLGRGTNSVRPYCRLGGVYIIRDMQTYPTCSVKGHKLE